MFVGGAAAVAVMLAVAAGPTFAGEPALTMRATVVGAGAAPSLTIELLRWSTDTERTPLLAAMSAPPPLSAAPASTTVAPAGAASFSSRSTSTPTASGSCPGARRTVKFACACAGIVVFFRPGFPPMIPFTSTDGSAVVRR